MVRSMSKDSKSERIYFYDNLRWLFVILVAVQHAALAYSRVGWWPVAEREKSMLADWLMAFCDASTMPMLFYIAGVFALPVLRRKGLGAFTLGKFKRLGLPWLVCGLVICPIVPFVYHYTRGGLILTRSYWDSWLVTMQSFLGFDFGLLPPMSTVMQQDIFYQRYMWFLGLLLAFFLIFGAAYALWRGWFDNREINQAPINMTGLKTAGFIAATGGAVFLASCAVIMLMFVSSPGMTDPEVWFSVFNVIQFQPSRVFMYLTCFGLGVLSDRNNWTARGMFNGGIVSWLAPSLVLLAAYIWLRHIMFYGPAETMKLFGLLTFFSRNLLSIALLGLFTALGLKFWNTQGRVARNLAANSYDIYLSHYALVIWFQLMLLAMPGIGPTAKFITVATLAAAYAWAISNFLLRPRPIPAIGAAGALLAGMALWIKP